MGAVHPVVVQRVLGLALGAALVAAPQHESRWRWCELLREVTGHLTLLGQLMTHDEHLFRMRVNRAGRPHGGS